MGRGRRLASLVAVVAVAAAWWRSGPAVGPFPAPGGAPGALRVTLAATSDLHNNDAAYASLLALFRRERSERRAFVLLDAGDASRGTPLQEVSAAATDGGVPELEFLALAGYDAFTLGNHDFDLGVDALLGRLSRARRNGLEAPLLLANLVPGGPLAAFAEPSAVVARGGVRVGVIGLMGTDAALVSSTGRLGSSVAFVGFDDASASADPSALAGVARAEARRLRDEERCDLVVAILHGGEREDARLAADVPELDAIFSSHEHFRYARYYPGPRTYVTQCALGGKGDYAAVMRLEIPPVGPVAGTAECEPMTHTAPEEGSELEAAMGRWHDALDAVVSSSAETAFGLDDLLYTQEPGASAGGLFDAGFDILDSATVAFSLALQQLNVELAAQGQAPADVWLFGCDWMRFNPAQPLAEGRPVELRYRDVYNLLPHVHHGVSVVHMYESDLRAFFTATDLASVFLSPLMAFRASDTLWYEYNRYGVPWVNRFSGMTLHGRPLRRDRLARVAVSSMVAGVLAETHPSILGQALQPAVRDQAGAPLSKSNADAIAATAVPGAKEHELLARALANRARHASSSSSSSYS